MSFFTCKQINDQQVFALAGVAQACALIQNIAHQGAPYSAAMEASISSILVTNPDNIAQIYGKVSNLKLGLNTLVDKLIALRNSRDQELATYFVGVLMIEKRLRKTPKVLRELASRIEHVQRQVQHFDFEHPQVLASLASIYSDLLSPLVNRKIMIQGKQHILMQEQHQHQIRALLLSGVRAAVLWRQLGGRSRYLFFQRQQLSQLAKQILSQPSYTH